MDERVISEQRRAQAGAFSIMFFGLLAVLVYRSIIVDQSFNEYVDIFVVWLAAGVYATVSSVLRGVEPGGESRRKWLLGVAVGLAVTAVQVYDSITAFGVDFNTAIAWVAPLLTFVFAFGFVMVVQAVLAYLYRRWEKRTFE